MSMISYSLDSIFYEYSKYAIRIDMQISVLYLLKIENIDKSPRERSKTLRMSQGSTLHTMNPDLGGLKLNLLKIESTCMILGKMSSGLVSCKDQPCKLKTVK